MSTLKTLLNVCFDSDIQAAEQCAVARSGLWEKWLLPILADTPVGEDPGYDDDFQRLREEVNKLSGVDTALVCQLSEALLTRRCKDLRVAGYYLWARTHQDGDAGLADGLALLSGLVTRYGEGLLPARANSRKTALQWLAGGKLQDAIARHPEVEKSEFAHAVASLSCLQQTLDHWDENTRCDFAPLISAMEMRLARAGGVDALVPQLAAGPVENQSRAALNPVQSGRDLLSQGKALAQYLCDQPRGSLAGARLMRVLRWDTLHDMPLEEAGGNTRLLPPKAELRGQLKRLYLQQNWLALREQVESLFAVGVNHVWLDLQWYACHALKQAGQPYDVWEELFRQDLRLLLMRLPGLEQQSYSDGTPFADETTRAWIEQQVQVSAEHWTPLVASAGADDTSDILALEGEALAQVDSDGFEAALAWLDRLPGVNSARQRWLQRLLMARVAEQCGKNEVAMHLLTELDEAPAALSLAQWEPQLCFEVKARLLKSLRLKAQRNDSDKAALSRQMEPLLAGLVAIDPARAAVLCG
ncbi:MAG: type VI secretion system protein TssA [Pseudomonas sp.]